MKIKYNPVPYVCPILKTTCLLRRNLQKAPRHMTPDHDRWPRRGIAVFENCVFDQYTNIVVIRWEYEIIS